MANASTLGNQLGALLSEIEEAYNNEILPKHASQSMRKEVLNEDEFIRESLKSLSKEEIAFINGYIGPYEKIIVIQTLLFMGKLEKPHIKKTHSHIQVVTAISNSKKENPNFSATELISHVADLLGMTSRAVRKHYYQK